MSNLLSQASLVMIPSGYKEDVVYSQIPTDGSGDLSFTRASNGTRINSAGLVEDVPWNLLQQSETFDSVSWGKSAVGINTSIGTSGIQSNVADAPNGTLTADRVNFNLQSDLDSGLNQTYSSAIASQSFVSSIYVKGEGSNIGKQIKLRIKRSTGGTFVSVDTTITLTADWVQITSSALTLLANNTGVFYIISSNDATNALIWGAQLNIGSTAKPYFPTTDRLNVPRLTYQNGGGGCPSLLLEPQRTNTMLYSQAINSWATKTELTITDNYATSPDGTQSASYIQQTTGGNAVNLSSQNISVTTGQVQTITFYAKAKEVTSISFRLGGTTAWAGGTRPIFNCNLSTGGITIQTGSITVSSESVGNGWYRFIVVTAATIASTSVALQTPTGTIYSSTSGDGFYLWGVQWEQNASYPTSYIPTTSSSATKVADAFSRNNIYTNGLISASGGTWFVELRGNVAYSRDVFGALWVGSDSTSANNGNSLSIRNSGGASRRLSLVKTVSGTISSLYETTTDIIKVAIKWNGTSADYFVNGTKQVSATPFTATNMEFLAQNAIVPMFISQMDLFPTALTDAQCQALTTL